MVSYKYTEVDVGKSWKKILATYTDLAKYVAWIYLGILCWPFKKPLYI